MVRNIVVLGGNSHPGFVDSVCEFLSIPASNRILSKFSCGESRCEIKDSVRGKDVYIIQSFGIGTDGNRVNDHFVELCIMISACKMGSAKRVTAVLPLFPYSRQPDLPYKKAGAPLSKAPSEFAFDSIPPTPGPNMPRTPGMSHGADITEMMAKASFFGGAAAHNGATTNGSGQGLKKMYTTHDYENPSLIMAFQAKPGYKQWVAQAGNLVADLLIGAGADRILTCDLHESTYQGFFDIPVDNLFGRPLLSRYIQTNIENYKDAVIVSPDAGGAKRATAIADGLGMPFALIHKERRPTKITESQKASMMLVGNVANRVCILVDDLADTSSTIVRAAKLLKKERATKVYALLTHGVFSGDAIERINNSALDKVVVTNTVAQDEHKAQCPKLEVLEISRYFAEAIRRVHHGESISVLFQYD